MRTTLFDFTDPSAANAWHAIDDRVMGGISRSTLRHDPAGHALFEGTVSLERNGGFASVRSSPGERGLAGAGSCLIELRGDNKQFKLSLLTDDGFDSSELPSQFRPQGHRLADLAPAAGRLPRQLPWTRGHRRTATRPCAHPPGRPDDCGTPSRRLRARHPADRSGLSACRKGAADAPSAA